MDSVVFDDDMIWYISDSRVLYHYHSYIRKAPRAMVVCLYRVS